MAVRVKSFRVTNEAEENEVNQFLENKVVRHWGTQFSGDPINGIWHLFVAFEERHEQPERRTPRAGEGKNDRGDRGDRNDRDDRRDRNDRGDRNDRNDRNDRGPRDAKNDRGPKRDGPREKPPRPDHVVDVSQEDMPLYEAIRKWRNGIAKDKDLKPFSLFNNRQLQAIVKEKPQSDEALKPLLPEIAPELFEKYHNELLGLLSGAASNSAGSNGVDSNGAHASGDQSGAPASTDSAS